MPDRRAQPVSHYSYAWTKKSMTSRTLGSGWREYGCISASSAQDALRRILDERVELLVLDTLPIYVQGLPSLLELKQGREYFHVILIPGLAETPQVGVARISGVDAVLVRPLSKFKLLSVIDALG